MTDISTTYLGLQLSNPIVPSASPLSQDIDNIKWMEERGAGAVVLYSLFEEQITAESHELDRFLTQGAESHAEALSYFPDIGEYRLAPDQYVDHVHRAKQAVGIPIIASLNGVSSGGWLKYAQSIEQAGADALELNVYYIPTDPFMSSESVENDYLELLRELKKIVRIPVAVKVSPFFSNFASMARRLDEAGANGLVLFNRFYQPDFDLDRLEVDHHADLSRADNSHSMRLPLRWIAILFGRIQADMAATGGIHSATDAIKMLLAGASVTMMASELMQHGIHRIADIRQEMIDWLVAHEYESVEQLRGSMSQRAVAHPAAFERAHYMRILTEYRPIWR